ncbi:hypothetical protein Rsub_01718 [Raphidocelis subcapitata]|uniref:HD domain-containing protein n=1 Tax=Raphidocelis subcapitata TaxID=307507 RepID=A0A2V0NV46_9CHLO|nr:hypothetical protein Rsub_01718 [Raphidocelis subcapitata]|eukprot:GBF88817.1 hypothetical protein Rsub_01718 [Raphidocelis subcapitata]
MAEPQPQPQPQPQPPPPLPPWPHATAMPAAEAFEGTWRRSGGGLRQDQQAAVFSFLEAAYAMPHRHYHTMQHILEGLSFVGMCLLSGRSFEDQAAVEWAIWTHDLVYDARATDNERRSADAAAELLEGVGLPPATVARMRSLILETATHMHSGDRDAHVVVDADLAVLGAPLGRYMDYVTGVRREYGHLSDEEWAEGRCRFLRSLLDREQLFATDVGKGLCEAQARANLSHELQLLSCGLPVVAQLEGELPAVAEGEEGEEEAAAA